MSCELNLRFPNNNQVVVKFDEQETDALDFVSPLNEEDLQDIRWYLETYSAQYTTDVDDERAQKIAAKLPQWGEDLFEAVFNSRVAGRIFNDFQDEEEEGKLLTISASHPAILSLPWELLRDSEGTYLVHDNPRISVRRRLAGAGGGRRAFKVKTKEKLRLLFVVSRPSGAGFIDPRGEAQAVIRAIEQEAAGCVEVEFLRPATVDNLVERLEDKRQPKVDIVHFDGHGVFDKVTNTGYLLFEDERGRHAPITAETLGKILQSHEVSLVVLSACQSATVAGEEAIGSVAARLTHEGIPAVLAMTYSVLVVTTQILFGEFYRTLVGGKGIGEALDSARQYLFENPQRGERQRGREQIERRLHDWCLPALYQEGEDTPLLVEGAGEVGGVEEAEEEKNNLPQLQKAGFFGRSRELWQIEKAFVRGTQRITISGFGGQGKTYLAAETGRWFCNTGLFEKAGFVSYDGFKEVDAVGLAVSTLRTVLEQSFVDAEAVTAYLMAKDDSAQPALLILDNLESLATQPRQELLDVAGEWSKTDKLRLLLTTRMADWQHADYSNRDSFEHISLPLKGLSEVDTLNYFQQLMKLPPAPEVELPKRQELMDLFKQVDFHPLSINLLSQQLKMRRPAELGQRLEALVAQTPDNPLLVSLNLSLERLDTEAQQLLSKLGVFQGGAMEPEILRITQFSKSQWQNLRLALENTGLIQVEYLSDADLTFLKFHPTLAPVLWLRLTKDEQFHLLLHHGMSYRDLARFLYEEDQKDPDFSRTIAQKELPNLLSAVQRAISLQESSSVEFVYIFVNHVEHFLDCFRMSQSWQTLNQRLSQQEKIAVSLRDKLASDQNHSKVITFKLPVNELVSKDDYEAVLRANKYLARVMHGERLYKQERYKEAAQVFTRILDDLGEAPSFKKVKVLIDLGCCFRFQGQATQAMKIFRQGLQISTQLGNSDDVKNQRGVLTAYIADSLRDSGQYQEATGYYRMSINLYREVGNLRGEAISDFQLGTLEMLQGKLREATQRYQKFLQTFQKLKEPIQQAIALHQLGMVYLQQHKWELAENAYRQSAQISESQGNLARAIKSWNNLALVNTCMGRFEEAEALYRKAIKGKRKVGEQASLPNSLTKLAYVIIKKSDRFIEAQQLAEEALTINQILDIDPVVGQIWETYELLEKISKKQKNITQAKKYRCLARKAKATFAGTRYELKKYGKLIVNVVAAVDDPEVWELLKADRVDTPSAKSAGFFILRLDLL